MEFNNLINKNGIYYPVSKTPFTGKHVLKYKNGNKKREYNFKNGLFNGMCTEWYENGNKYRVSFYKKGVLDGNVAGWDKNGLLMFNNKYKDGKKIC